MTSTTPTDDSAVPAGELDNNPQPVKRKSRLSGAAITLGIIGIVFAFIPHASGFGIFLGVLAAVFGIIGLRRKVQRALAGTVLGVLAVVLGSIFAGVYGGGSTDSAAPVAPTSTTAGNTSASAVPVAADEESAPAAKPAEPSGTVGQLQALAAAKGYLRSGMGFSQSSLTEQLTSSAGNGFAQADADWAVAHSGADWNAQAASAAKGYLTSGMGFSQASLTAQLTSSAGNGFTAEQAADAVSKSGADWNAQAVDAAKGYVSSGMGFSRSSLIEQLSSTAGNQFTQAQAEYAASKVGLN